MFNCQNFGCNLFRRIVRLNRNLSLQHDGAAIKLFIYYVHRGAGDAFAVRDNSLVDVLPVHPLAAILRKQGRVDIDDTIAVRRDHTVMQLLHVPCQRDEIHLVLPESLQQRSNKLFFTRELPLTQMDRGDSMYACDFQDAGAGIVADDNPNPNTGQRASLKSIEYRLKIGTSSRSQNRDLQHAAQRLRVINECMKLKLFCNKGNKSGSDLKVARVRQ